MRKWLLRKSRNLHRCQALSSEGRLCRREAVLRMIYHGDSEIYSGRDRGYPIQTVVFLCKKHVEKEDLMETTNE